MKTFKYLVIVLAAFFLFSACEKEASQESGVTKTLAIGSLKSVSGDCQPITLQGVYMEDSALHDNNTVAVQVRITTPGFYKIISDTANGFMFRDSGYVADTGLHSFTLKATGKPAIAKQTDFLVSFSSTFCTFTINVIRKKIAAFTLADDAGNCAGASAKGSYVAGVSLTAANTVDLQVNVDSAGSYSITTVTVGGITFSGSGTFSRTGLQTITLSGSGTPAIKGVNKIPVTAGGSNCSFNVTFL